VRGPQQDVIGAVPRHPAELLGEHARTISSAA
jgi:hypothetical protein